MSWWSKRWELPQVNGTLLPYKLFYLVQFCGLACMSPFLPVFFRLRGLSESQIGFLGFLYPAMGIPTVPVWSALVDKLGQKKAILLGTTLGATFFRFLYIYPPSFTTLIPLVVLANALGGAPMVLADAFTMDVLEDKTEYGKQRLWGAVGWGLAAPLCGAIVTATRIESAFYLHAMFMVAAAAVATQFRFNSPEQQQDYSQPSAGITKIDIDTDQSQQIEMHAKDSQSTNAKRSALSSSQRDTAANSAVTKSGFDTVEMGRNEEPTESEALIPSEYKQHAQPSDRLSPKSLPFDPTHSNKAPSQTPANPPPSLDPLQKRPDLQPPDTKQIPELPDPPPQPSLVALFRDPSVCSFFVIITLMGVAMGVIDGFLPLRLNELGGSPTLIGLALTVTCVAEVPMMWFSGRLIKALGVLGVLYLALACYVTRFVYYSLLKQPWAVLPVELLHGVTFGCGWTAGTVHSGRIAPAGMGATMQALFSGAYFGIGDGMGMLIGGMIYERYGSVVLFRGAGILVAAGALLFGLSQQWCPLEERDSAEEGGNGEAQRIVELDPFDGEAKGNPALSAAPLDDQSIEPQELVTL